nr:MAG TPA: hypothetical protein [Caudoviricetes sp.]
MNREDNYYYNGSGYADPTAAAVIGKMTKERQTMTDPKPFEIWQFADSSTALITAVSDYNMQYVKIYNTPSARPDEIEISGKYFNPHYLAYSFTDNCTNFLRVLKNDEICKVKTAIASVFGIGGEAETDALKQKLNDRGAEMSELRKALDAANDTIAQLRHGSPDVSKLEKKISSQQIMIDLLIEKLTEARCGKE